MNFMENCVRLTKSPYYNKPMVLMLWQKAFIETCYSFKMADTGLDRFKKIILLIARKNTKSEMCSALGLSELIVGNDGADIVCSSNNDTDASITYDAINKMRQLIDPHDLDTKKISDLLRISRMVPKYLNFQTVQHRKKEETLTSQLSMKHMK